MLSFMLNEAAGEYSAAGDDADDAYIANRDNVGCAGDCMLLLLLLLLLLE